MAKRPPDVHCWFVWRKVHEVVSDFLYRGLEETRISDTDFRVLEALLHKGPLPINTITPKSQASLEMSLFTSLEVSLFLLCGCHWAAAGAQPCAAVWAARLGRSGGGDPNEC